MPRNGKTTVASKLKKERIFINRHGDVVDRDEVGKRDPENDEMSREEEIAYHKSQLKKLEDNA